MRYLLYVFCILFPLSVFGTGSVCPAGYQPEEYTQLEYIESTGTQYINIDIAHNENINITSEFAITDVLATTNYVFGSYVHFGAQQTTRLQFSYSAQAFFGWGTDYTTPTIAMNTNKHRLTVNKNMFTIDDTTVYVPTSPSFSTTYMPLYLFGIFRDDRASGYSKIKIYSFTLSDNGMMLYNLIPAKRNSDGKIGMYDTVSGNFFTNAGTGEFIAGPTVGVMDVRSDVCAPCPANTYKPNAGNEECTPCPEKTFSPMGSTSIEECAKILNINDSIVYMPVGKRTEHGLCVRIDGEKYCADMYKKD